MNPVEVGRRREGAESVRPLQSAGDEVPVVESILDQVQIDHTVMDLIVVDDRDRQPIGRPYLTVAIDVCSRCLVGMVVTLEPPSAVSVGLCLAHAAGVLGGLLGGLGDGAHLLDHPEQARLVDFGGPTLAQPGQSLPVLPHADRRVRQRPIRDLDVRGALGVQHPDAADIARIPPDEEPLQGLAACDPRLERIGEIVDMVQNKPGARELAAEHGQKVH